jgi:hypothetical protein
MADPIKIDPWWVTFLTWLEKTIKENWSGLAVIIYGYEEKKIDAAKQEQKTAELKEKLAEDEIKIRKDASTKSDDDIIKEQLGTKRDDNQS